MSLSMAATLSSGEMEAPLRRRCAVALTAGCPVGVTREVLVYNRPASSGIERPKVFGIRIVAVRGSRPRRLGKGNRGGGP